MYGAGSHSGTDGSGLSGKLLFLTCGIVHEADPPAAHDLFRGHRCMDSAEAGIRNQADSGDCGDYHYSPRHLRFAAGGLPVQGEVQLLVAGPAVCSADRGLSLIHISRTIPWLSAPILSLITLKSS